MRTLGCSVAVLCRDLGAKISDHIGSKYEFINIQSKKFEPNICVPVVAPSKNPGAIPKLYILN